MHIYIYVRVKEGHAKESRFCFCAQTLKARIIRSFAYPILLIRRHEGFLLRRKVKHHPINAPTRRHRDISQTKLRTSVLLRQRAAERLVLAFAICKSRRAGHYGTAILAFPLFFSPIRIWSSSGTRSLNHAGWGKKRGRKRERGD